jgi:tRNA pseudouridine55 synthase
VSSVSPGKTQGAALHGVLVIDKPTGLTSAQVVARVKRTLGASSAGHTGTLDPMATGVLPIVLGEATKIAGFLLADDKAYDGELELGVTTATLDAEGQVETRADPAQVGRIDAAELARAMAPLVGAIEQVPPAYSAIKVGGRRLHELARAGEAPTLTARPVRVDRFALVDFVPPRARFQVACSKGTYVRSLVRDLGSALGVGACLTALRRTRSGSLALADSVPLEGLTPELAAARLISPAQALGHLPVLSLDAEAVTRVRHGKPVAAPAAVAPTTILRLVGPGGELVALMQATSAETLTYLRVFPPMAKAG